MEELQNRKGRIKISNELYASMELEFIKLLFGNFYPFYVVDNPIEPYINYYGLSEHFELVNQGEEIPDYDAVFNSVTKTIKFKKT